MNDARRASLVAGIGAVAFLVGVVWVGSRWFAQAPPPVTIGSAAPEFRVASVQPAGPPRTLADYAGHPLLLNFWATWCQPCRKEMSSFERLYRADSARGLRIVAISIDAAGADAAIREFIRSYGVTFDVLHDARSAVMARYQVRGVPETFLIRADGRIAGTRYVRDWDSPGSAALVDSLLLGGSRVGIRTGASARQVIRMGRIDRESELGAVSGTLGSPGGLPSAVELLGKPPNAPSGSSGQSGSSRPDSPLPMLEPRYVPM